MNTRGSQISPSNKTQNMMYATHNYEQMQAYSENVDLLPGMKQDIDGNGDLDPNDPYDLGQMAAQAGVPMG